MAMTEAAFEPQQAAVWIVEDEAPAAELAADLCQAGQLHAQLFRSPLPFLRAFADAPPPAAVVLDWRLEHELTAGLFLATRHRFPRLPVIYWTGSEPEMLPAMIREDPLTRIVGKTEGAAAFEAALDWALSVPARHARDESFGAQPA